MNVNLTLLDEMVLQYLARYYKIPDDVCICGDLVHLVSHSQEKLAALTVCKLTRLLPFFSGDQAKGCER